MRSNLASAVQNPYAGSELLYFAIQMELGLRENAGNWRSEPDEALETAYELLRSGALDAAVVQSLREAVEESDRSVRARHRTGSKGAAADKGIIHSDLQQRIGLVVRRLRENARLTQQTLAAMCGITQASVSHFERGKRINSINALERISNALGLSLGRLIALANLEDFEGDVLLSEALESAAEVAAGGAVPFDEVMKRLGIG